MSFLAKLVEIVGDAASDAISRFIEAVRTLFEGDPETRRKVAFSVAMIALSAKMAKAGGTDLPTMQDKGVEEDEAVFWHCCVARREPISCYSLPHRRTKS